MNRTIRGIFVALAIMLVVGLAIGETNDLRQRTTEPAQQSPVARPFKLKAAGQISLATGEIMFGGVATHLGLYTASGFFNPGDFSIFGTIVAANGDTLNFTAGFGIAPGGDIEATFEVTGGTGRFADAVGTATGPVALDPDFTFLIKANGDLDY